MPVAMVDKMQALPKGSYRLLTREELRAFRLFRLKTQTNVKNKLAIEKKK